MSWEPWLNKRELAAHYGISARTVERQGIPPTRRIGGQNRYLISAVEEWFRTHGDRPDNVVELRR